MNKQTTNQIRREQQKLLLKWHELENLADEIEAVSMKKTTQRSPEFRGGSNC